MTTKPILGLCNITTNAELIEYVTDSDILKSFPRETDALFLLKRFYAGETFNWCRSLDQVIVLRDIIRNCGTVSSSDSSSSGTSSELASAQNKIPSFSVPDSSKIFGWVWDKMPDYVQDKMKSWAADGQAGTIAQEIAEYVHIVIGIFLPEIPAVFVDAVANVIIPPLVVYVINKFTTSSSNNQQANAFKKHTYLSFAHTPKAFKTMKTHDRRILLAAGLSASELPRHLKLEQDDDADADSSSDASSSVKTPAIIGQPDKHDTKLDLLHLYQLVVPNGCNPLQLTQVVAAQMRTNPDSDPPVDDFAQKVWDGLSSDTQTTIKDLVTADEENSIADMIYRPVRKLLSSTYLVPEAILDTFCAMKVPEVVQWIMDNEAGGSDSGSDAGSDAGGNAGSDTGTSARAKAGRNAAKAGRNAGANAGANAGRNAGRNAGGGAERPAAPGGLPTQPRVRETAYRRRD